MALNTRDKSDFICDDVHISHTIRFVYLGTPFTTESLSNHLNSKAGHVLKFASFLRKNYDAPFYVKSQVWKSAVISALFFGCETWLMSDFRAAESVYMNTVKQLVGIRNSVCNDIVLVELGIGDAQSFVRQRQASFLRKLRIRDSFHGSYLDQIIQKALNSNSPSGVHPIGHRLY